VHRREMHRGWGNTDGVGDISPRFSTAKALSQIDNAGGSDNIRHKASDLKVLRHAEEGERELSQVERYHGRLLAYNPLSGAAAP
jgi:hypothetical protein